MSVGGYGIGAGGFGDYAPFAAAASLTDWEVPAGGVGSLGFTNTGLGLDTSTGDLLIGDFTNTRVVRASAAGAYVGEIVLGGSPPANSVQGVAYDTSDGSIWVAHYVTGGGSIRRYNTSGTLQQTISFAAVNGPNGIVYDAANDYILALADDCKIRTYNAATGSLVSTVDVDPIVGPTSSGVTDGVWIDLADTNWLFVSEDNTSSDADRIWRINRQSGAVDRGWKVPEDVESLVAYGGYLWLCCDKFYHSGTANGNRVFKLAITATSQAVSATITPSGIASAEAFGSATVAPGSVTIAPTGIASAEAFGSAIVAPGAVTITPTGIASEEAFGTATLLAGTYILATGIASAEAFGSATVVPGSVTIAATGIASEEAFGSATVAAAELQTIVAAGIASAEAFGSAVVLLAGSSTLLTVTSATARVTTCSANDTRYGGVVAAEALVA